MKNPRLLLAAMVAIVAVALGIGFLPGAGGDADDETTYPRPGTRGMLTLERAVRPDTGGQELLVSLPGPQLNTPQINHGATVALLRAPL